MSTSNNNNNQVWFITGCTSGTGLALATLLISKNYKVAGTSRSIKKFSTLEIANHPNFLGLEVDIINENSVKDAINKTIQHFGDLTHIVNNAGYGLMGAVEEISDEENRKLFDALYFGPLNVIRASLPHLRSKKYGYIFNVSSISGFVGGKYRGAYCGAKFAISGLTQSLAEDVQSLNIKVGNIILGSFATGFTDNLETPSSRIPDYNTEKYLQERLALISTIPTGRSEKFAEILIEYSKQETIPYNIFIGQDAIFNMAETKVQQLSDQISSQKERNSKVI